MDWASWLACSSFGTAGGIRKVRCLIGSRNGSQPGHSKIAPGIRCRAGDLRIKGLCSSENPAYKWMINDRHNGIRVLLTANLPGKLSDLQIMETGCGSGA